MRESERIMLSLWVYAYNSGKLKKLEYMTCNAHTHTVAKKIILSLQAFTVILSTYICPLREEWDKKVFFMLKPIIREPYAKFLPI